MYVHRFLLKNLKMIYNIWVDYHFRLVSDFMSVNATNDDFIFCGRYLFLLVNQ